MKQTVSGTTVTLTANNQVRIERDFNLTAAQLFQAHTDPALIRQWMSGMPGWSLPVCEVDLRVGGTYRWEWASPDGAKMAVGGTFKEIVPNTRLVQSEIYDDPWYPGGCDVALSFSDSSPSLVMLLTYEDPAARDIALQTGMSDGLEIGYKRLDSLFS